MKLFYELVGRIMVGRFLVRRGTQLRAAAVVAVLAAGIVAYLSASREADED